MANIQKRGDGSYFFTVSLGRGPDGKYKRATKTYKPERKMTPKQMKEHIEHEYMKFKEEIRSGVYVSPEKMTLEAFTHEWRKKYADNELSETAMLGHLSRLENHILPVIGHVRMDQINSMMLLTLLSSLSRKDGKEGSLSNYMKEDIYKTLKNVFKHAAKWKVTATNPMDGVNKPRDKNEESRDVSVYEPEEVAALLTAAQNEPLHWRIFITLAIVAGVRRGENLGIEWPLVDFTNNTVDVSQSIVKGLNGAVIKTPKSKSSRRLISLPPSVMEELRLFRIQWVSDRLKMGDKWTEHEREWLFCKEDGKHFYPTTPTKWWKGFTERAGVRYIRLHDLRHTSATLLIAKGVHAKIISERLGHSSIKITMNTYGHALRSADEAAGNTFESLFAPSVDSGELM